MTPDRTSNRLELPKDRLFSFGMRSLKLWIRYAAFGSAYFFAAVACLFGQKTETQYLSGHGKDDAVPWEFFCTSGAQSGYWTNIPVPSNWEMHGFGTLNYHRDLTNAWNEKGLYRRRFVAPENWLGRRVFLIFDGVMTDTSAKLNGHSVGPMHQGGFYRFQYEVTSLIQLGATNLLEVTVAKHSSDASVNRAERLGDYWVFGGIYRPVYLEAVPRQFIERVAIDASASGQFRMEVYLNGATPGDEVEAQLETLDGEKVGSPFSREVTDPEVVLQSRTESPKLWTAETPNLYRVEVRLKHGGKIIHQIERQFGFRTFEVRDGEGLFLNGQRVVLKGCNRHSFWPDSGRCLSDSVQRLDIETMKAMNINAVRMSHYPPDGDFLDQCDRLGLYVLDELAGWQHYYDTEIGRKLVREMVTRDVNHPCILFWDNGNEGGYNTNLDAVFGAFDPQHRRVLHPRASFGGVNTDHYAPYRRVQLACEGWPLSHHQPDTNAAQKWIYMPTEFLHGLYDGGAGAGLSDMWGLMERSPYLGGGFIWAYLDEGVRRPDTGQIDVAGNQAPDGIVGPYRQREASFYTIKQIWSPIQITRLSDGRLSIANHYSFTDASQCGFDWQLRKFTGPDESITGFVVLAHGKVTCPEIPPRHQVVVRLELPESERSADALAVRVRDPHGQELWTWVWPLGGIDRFSRMCDLPSPGTGRVRLTETDELVTVTAGDLRIRFDKDTGFLKDAQQGQQLFSLGNGPRPAADNDVRLIHVHSGIKGGDAVITATYEGALRQVTWRVRPNGWVRCGYRYRTEGPGSFFGVAFDYPEKLVRAKKWLGDGPYRVWKNRRHGVTLGVWSDAYNNTITGWRDWIYPEFKGCFSGVRWLQLETAEGKITVVPEGAPFVQVLTPAFPPANLVRNTAVDLPKCGLAFLDAIPPIGTKFLDPKDLGPHGQLTVGQAEYEEAVEFHFGNLHDEPVQN